MVHGIHQSFLNGIHRVADKTTGFRTALMFEHLFTHGPVFDVPQSFPDLFVNRPQKRFLDQFIATRTGRENHHFDLGTWHESSRIFMKEQQAYIPRFQELICPIDDIHLTTQIDKRHLTRLTSQITADFLQIQTNHRQPQIIDIRTLALSIIKRHRSRKAKQLLFILAVRLQFNRAGIPADEIVILFVLRRHCPRSLVRSIQSTGSPQDDQMSSLDLFNTQHRKVRRLNRLAILQQLTLDQIQLILLQTDWRKDGRPVFIAILTDNHIAAAEILEVIRKRAQSSNDRIGIPASFVLNAIPFDPSLAK